MRPGFFLTKLLESNLMAATTQSVQYAAQVAAAANFSSTSRLDKRTNEGTIQYAFVDVVVDAANTTADVVTLLKLPAGAIIYPELSRIITTDDMSSGTVTIDIGDIVDPDRYCDGAVCSAVGEVLFTTPAIPAAYTTRHPVNATGVSTTDTSLVTLTFAGLAATVEAGALRVVLAYKSL